MTPPTNKNLEQTATIASLETEVRGIHKAIDELHAGQTRLVAQNAKTTVAVERLSASVNALVQRDQRDIQQLYELNGEHTRAIHKLREEHIPESELRENFNRLGDRFERVDVRIASLNSRVNWILGIGATVVVMIQVAKVVISWVTG